jgi:hypothetical protein
VAAVAAGRPTADAAAVVVPVVARAGRRNSYAVLFVDEVIRLAVFPGRRVGGIRPVEIGGVRLAAETVP